MKRLQLVSADQAVEANGRHTKPCGDCPWARASLPGWLGGPSADDWLKEAHGDHPIPCHTLRGAQCAGAATYRRNVAKIPRDKECLRLEANRDLVFATPTEFRRHHERAAGESVPGPDKAEGTQGTPQGVHEMANDKSGNVTKADAISELKAKNVTAMSLLRDKHAKAVLALKASNDKKLAAIAAKTKKATDRIVNDLSAVDDILVEISGAVTKGGDLARVRKAVAAMVSRGRRIAEKHLK